MCVTATPLSRFGCVGLRHDQVPQLPDKLLKCLEELGIGDLNQPAPPLLTRGAATAGATGSPVRRRGEPFSSSAPPSRSQARRRALPPSIMKARTTAPRALPSSEPMGIVISRGREVESAPLFAAYVYAPAPARDADAPEAAALTLV